MASRQHKPEWDLPSFREAYQMPDSSKDFYGIQFYPWTKPGATPVFAIVGGQRILICRTPSAAKETSKAEITQFVIDAGISKNKEGEDVEEDYWTCVWTKDFETGAPLLCVAGLHGSIKIVNALTGKLVRVLSGHGGGVNDLVISPSNPHILASASEDLNVRLWSLDPAHEKQPCAAILEGDGHRATVMSLSFHATNKYIISGGQDRMINLWALPELPDSNTGTNTPTRIYYPHFSTSEIHGDLVDCVAFHNDLILSKAANENIIVLWAISNFSSKNDPPPRPSAPTTHDTQRDTRSFFMNASTRPLAQYVRLLQFNIPDSQILFTRFSLFPGGSGMNSVLAFCNAGSKVFFWDLDRLAEYVDATRDGGDLKDPSNRPTFLNPFQHRVRGGRVGRGGAMARIHRETSPTESSNSYQTGSDQAEKEKDKDKGKVDWDRSMDRWAKKYQVGNTLRLIEAHKEEVVKGLGFTGRYIAWSRDGQWCVVVGSAGVFALLQRWGK